MVAPIVYPRPRQRIGGPPPIGTPQAANPTVRLWPLHWLESSGVAVLVSPSFIGPAILDELVLELPTASPLPMPTISIYYAGDNGGGGNNQALGTIPSGTRIFENLTLQRDDANTSSDFLGFNVFNMNEASTGFQRLPLKFLVTLPTFFVKLRVQNSVAAITSGLGYLRVLEAVPPDQVPNFL